MATMIVKVKRFVGAHQEFDHDEPYVEVDYEYVDKEIELTLDDYIDYYASLLSGEVKQKYNMSVFFNKGFREAIKTVVNSQDLDDLDEYDEDFKDFIQERYGD